MIDPRKLRLLREFQARGTMTAVAQALSFTPSAVSQQLSRLEREVGVALFERTGRKVQLTEMGQRLAQHAQIILGAIDDAECDLANNTGSVEWRLRVATFQSIGLTLLAPALELLARTDPDVDVEVVAAEPEAAIPMLVVGDLDLVFVDDYGSSPPSLTGVDQELLLDDPLQVAVPAGDELAAQATVRIADLADRDWASGEPGSSYSNAVDSLCRELGAFTPRTRHRARDLILVLRLVEAGRAVALLPEILTDEAGEGVAIRRLHESTPARRIYTAVRSGSAASPSVIAFRRALRQTARSRSSSSRPAG
jgi:DNA-binding transcriptional LysR family regulator